MSRRHAGRRAVEAPPPPVRRAAPIARPPQYKLDQSLMYKLEQQHEAALSRARAAVANSEDALSRLDVNLAPSSAGACSGGQQALTHPHAVFIPGYAYEAPAVRSAPPPLPEYGAQYGAPAASSHAFAELVHARRQGSLDRATVATAGFGGGGGGGGGGGMPAYGNLAAYRPEGNSVPAVRPPVTDFTSACGMAGFADAVAAHLRGTSATGTSTPSAHGGVGTSVAAQLILSSRELAAQLMEAAQRQVLTATALSTAAAQTTCSRRPDEYQFRRPPAVKIGNGVNGAAHVHGSIVSGGGGGGEGGTAAANVPPARTAAPARTIVGASSPLPFSPGLSPGHRPPPSLTLGQSHLNGTTASPTGHVSPSPQYPTARREVEAIVAAMKQLPEGMGASERAAQVAAISNAISSQLASASEAHSHGRPPVETALRRRYTEAAFAAVSPQTHLQTQTRTANTASGLSAQQTASRPRPPGQTAGRETMYGSRQ